MELDKENVVQAVVLMDTFNDYFKPFTTNKPMAFLPLAGVPLIDFTLDQLALGGVGEAILFCCQDGTQVKEYIKNGVQNKALWSLTMEVQVMMSDTCQTMGDVMREIDAAGIIRGHFVLTGVNTLTNVNFASMLEQHKNLCKTDKGAAMTLVYKQVDWEHSLIKYDKSVFVAADGRTNKVLIHQKYKNKSQEKTVNLPLEIMLNHSEVKLHHNLIDANIALCSPAVPPLFCDNFDFQTRDDFIHGLLINEEILASSLYYTLIKPNQYAAAVTNWRTYKIVCRDVLHKWVSPLSIESGNISQNNYIACGYHVFREKNTTLSRSCVLVEDVLIGEKTTVGDNTTVTQSYIGKNCVIGNNVNISGCTIMDNIVVKDNCKLVNCFIDNKCVIEENSSLTGVIISENVKIDAKSEMKGSVVEASKNEGGRNCLKSTSESGTEWENESSGSDDDEVIGFDAHSDTKSESCYSSASSVESSAANSPAPDDTNIFLQEVIDSLARGYEEKLKCDYLILEINSSRYAYNIQLHEVNFFVVRALLSLPVLANNKNVLVIVKDILKFFHPVLVNYIKSKTSIMDCLRAVEDSCIQCEWLNEKSGHIIHMLYDADVVDEDSLLEWYEDLKENESPLIKQSSLTKFFEWLDDASEESE